MPLEDSVAEDFVDFPFHAAGSELETDLASFQDFDETDAQIEESRSSDMPADDEPEPIQQVGPPPRPKEKIPMLMHSTLDPGKFSDFLVDYKARLGRAPQLPFHPFPNESYHAFMHFVKEHPKTPNAFWNDLLKWFQARPVPVSAQELPKTLAEGLALLQTSSTTKKVGEFTSNVIGKMKDGTEVKVRCRNTMDCLFELLVEFYPVMLFEFDKKVGVDGKRVYGEYNTGSWWERQVLSLPHLAKLLAVEVYSDATQLDGGGKVSEHPIYLSLSNIPLSFRNKPKSKVLVAFVEKPWQKLSRVERDNDSHREFVRDMYHLTYQTIFKPIKDYQEFGFAFVLGSHMHHFIPRMTCFPGDMQEHYVIVRGGSTASKSPCNECMVQYHFLHMTRFEDEDGDDELASIYHTMLNVDHTLKPRTEGLMNAIIASGSKEKIKTASIHPGLNAFSGFILSPLYESIPSDYFMHGIAGINKHIFDNLMIFVEKEYKGTAKDLKETMGNRFRSMPRIDHSRLPTNSVMDSTNLSHKERSAITLVLLFAVHGSLTKKNHMTLFANMMIYHLQWQKLCRTTELPESAVLEIAEITEEFCLAFVAMFENIGSELQIPKLHMIVHHLTDSIRRFGIPLNWVTSMYEHFHHYIKNDYKYKGNKRDVVKGLISCNERKTAFAFLDTKFDESTQCNIEDKLSKTRFIGQQYAFTVIQSSHANGKVESLILSPVGLNSVANARKHLQDTENTSALTRASLGPTMSSTLNQITQILENMQIRLNQTDGVILDDSDTEPEFEEGQENSGVSYRYLKFHNSVIPAGTRYKYNACHSSYSYTRFSNVQLYAPVGSPSIFVKVLGLVSISKRMSNSGEIAGASAWVQFYEFAMPERKCIYGCPYLKLSMAKMLVAVDEFDKEVMMIPDFDHAEKNPADEIRYFQNIYL
ncbi:hypothetical protein BDR26DRAFT_903350 [Obelidium mucronatum]|nr:hypothetical protein BDR26DRAFT_903350 [Obelidium mucronatum]